MSKRRLISYLAGGLTFGLIVSSFIWLLGFQDGGWRIDVLILVVLLSAIVGDAVKNAVGRYQSERSKL